MNLFDKIKATIEEKTKPNNKKKPPERIAIFPSDGILSSFTYRFTHLLDSNDKIATYAFEPADIPVASENILHYVQLLQNLTKEKYSSYPLVNINSRLIVFNADPYAADGFSCLELSALLNNGKVSKNAYAVHYVIVSDTSKIHGNLWFTKNNVITKATLYTWHGSYGLFANFGIKDGIFTLIKLDQSKGDGTKKTIYNYNA